MQIPEPAKKRKLQYTLYTPNVNWSYFLVTSTDKLNIGVICGKNLDYWLSYIWRNSFRRKVFASLDKGWWFHREAYNLTKMWIIWIWEDTNLGSLVLNIQGRKWHDQLYHLQLQMYFLMPETSALHGFTAKMHPRDTT